MSSGNIIRAAGDAFVRVMQASQGRGPERITPERIEELRRLRDTRAARSWPDGGPAPAAGDASRGDRRPWEVVTERLSWCEMLRTALGR